MRYRVLLTVVALAAACPPSYAIDLARDGEALVPIVSDGSEGIEAAVADLKRHLDATTGGDFDLLGPDAQPEGPAIFVGPTHFTPEEADDERSRWLLEQIVQIQTRDGSLYLTGGGVDGARFAVYAFLEDLCGLRFFHPGELGTHIPSNADLSFNELAVRQAPEGIFEDYSLLLSDDLPPYLATSPGALLVPADD